MCVGNWSLTHGFTLPYEKIPSVTTGGIFHGMLRFMNKTYSTHITALLSAAGAVLAIVHPGFKIPVGVEGLFSALCLLASTGTEALHFVKKHNLESNIILAQHLASQVAANVKVDTTPVA